MSADIYDGTGKKVGHVVTSGDRLTRIIVGIFLFLALPGFFVSLSDEIDLKSFVASHQKLFNTLGDIITAIVLIALLFLVYKIIAAIVRGIKTIVNKTKQ